MKILKLKKHLKLALIGFVQLASAQQFDWAKRIGGPLQEEANAIATDAWGNVYTTGYFKGTVDFDPGIEPYNLTSAGDYDIFISKIDASGNFVWAKRIGSTSADVAFSIAVDMSGNVFTTGYFNGTVDFDPGVDTYNLTSLGGGNMFISKLDSLGNFQWAKRMGGTSLVNGRSIAVDASGHVYVTGVFMGTANFDPGLGTFNLSSAGSADIFIVKLDDLGNFIWAKAIGGELYDIVHAIALDDSGNVYTAGIFRETIDFDPGSASYPLTSAGENDIFILKLDPFGNFVWAKKMGGTSNDVCLAIALDNSGNIYSTGAFQGVADFDPGTSSFNLSTSSQFDSDVFISKLDPSGNFIWAKKIGGSFYDQGYGIVSDNTGNVYTTGTFSGTADFNPGPNAFNLSSAGGGDVFISKLDSLGNFVWAKAIGGSAYDKGLAITLDASENVYTTGTFWETADFNPSTESLNLTADGFFDIFIHK